MRDILFYISDLYGCGYYRTLQPVKEIRRQERKLNFKIKTQIDPADFSNAEAVVFQRSDSPEQLELFLYAKQKGVTVIYEMDDDLFRLSESNPSYSYFNYPKVRETIQEFILNADHIIVSTENLKKRLYHYSIPVSVCTNSIDFNLWDRYYNRKLKKDFQKDESKIIIGYTGSPSHVEDIKIIEQPLKKIFAKYPNVMLKCIGFDIRNLPEYSGVKDRIIFESHGTPYNFPEKMLDFDIGITPLIYSDFNLCKSNVKYLEYSALGIPTIATDIETYHCIDQFKTGMKIGLNCKSLWFNALDLLVTEKLLRKVIGFNAREYVKVNHNINLNYLNWYSAIRIVQERKLIASRLYD